eukprot:scaffold1982_cov93-Amphora_coffeaeformis.AAC.19
MYEMPPFLWWSLVAIDREEYGHSYSKRGLRAAILCVAAAAFASDRDKHKSEGGIFSTPGILLK